MKSAAVAQTIPIMLVIVGAVLLYVWFRADPASDIKMRLPGADNKPKVLVDDDEPIKIKGKLVKFDGVPADLPGAWPRFRGPDFDAISKEDITLARTWPADGPRILWSIEVGEGYAGAAVLAGRVYIMDYDRENEADSIRCLSLEDGEEIWRYSYPIKVKRFHGMSRTIPAVTDEYVVTIGPKCHVTCLDSMTGEFRWMLNLVKEFNTKVPQWYAGQCPLIEDGKAIIAPAGDVLMMAVDCQGGEIVWKTPNPDGWVMTHSSIVPMVFNSKRFYVYCGGAKDSGGVVGVSAEDGSVLWKTEQWRLRTNVPSPVIVGEDRIFLSAGYGQYENGCTMLHLTETDSTIKAQMEFLHPTEVFGSMQQTPIFYNGFIYGVRMDKQLVCLDLEGNIVWTSTSANKFGSGPYVIAKGLMYVLDDTGTLTMLEATHSGYVQLAQTRLPEGREYWGPMAVASGRLILRDLTRMICLDITEQ
jgi:outer membrane protein assembly factor BamB